MEIIALEIAASLSYLFAGLLQVLRLRGRFTHAKGLVWCLGLLAVTLHALLLHQWIDVAAGQNLSLFNVMSLVCWLVALMLLITSLVKPVENLFTLIFPLALISIMLVTLYPGSYLLQTAQHPEQLIHIILSITSASVLVIATFQALFLALQNHLLREKRTNGIIHMLPPLETMEMLLFEMIAVGLLLLTATLVTSVISFHDVLSPALLHKTFFAALSWCVFAALLLGRLLGGWRGKTVIRGTLGGMSLLILSYSLSKLLM